MISNYYGTLTRIVFLFLGLFFFWFGLVFLLYAIVASVFAFEICFTHVVLVFLGFLLGKMFYPKNVFA